MENDVTLGDGPSLRQRRRQRRDGIVADREDHDLDLADPWRRLCAIAGRQREGCWYFFVFVPVERDSIARLG
jgi:hypothetical protein